MKASEIITILHEQVAKRGDLEVQFHGCYGASETTFELMEPLEKLLPEDREYINVWTNIMTG